VSTSEDTLDLLEQLLLARGPGGQEEEVRDICQRLLGPLCDEFSVDAAGNLIGVLRAPQAAEGAIRVMAHLDEIAMVVKRIEESGALRVFALGGAYPVNFGMCPVDILGDH